jgi:hypothetical protein
MSLNSVVVVILSLCLLATQSKREPKSRERDQNRAQIIVRLTSSSPTVIICPNFLSVCNEIGWVFLNASATDPHGKGLKFTFSVPVGRLEGTGANVIWHFRGVEPGTYRAEVMAEDPKGNKAKAALQITAVTCTSCVPPPPPCPKITVECPSEVEKGEKIEFVVKVNGGESSTTPRYSWTSDAGRIVDGKYADRMTLDLLGFPFEKVTATVTVGGYDPSCPSVSCATRIKE